MFCTKEKLRLVDEAFFEAGVPELLVTTYMLIVRWWTMSFSYPHVGFLHMSLQCRSQEFQASHWSVSTAFQAILPESAHSCMPVIGKGISRTAYTFP